MYHRCPRPYTLPAAPPAAPPSAKSSEPRIPSTMWPTLQPLFIHHSAHPWRSAPPPPLLTSASSSQPQHPLTCSLKHHPAHPPRTTRSPRNPSRRAFLLAAALLAARSTPDFVNAANGAEPFESFTFRRLNIEIEYPKSWFRSERRGSLVMVNLRDVIAATVSRKALRLEPGADAFSVAYDMVKDRIEEEGSEIILKEASFDEDGALVFRFQADTLKPNGDVVRRVGVGRGVAQGDESVVCVVTAPKDGWATVEDVATRVAASLRVV